MLDFQQDFIELSINANALRFGEFTLKSGRNSPYFFNAGQFNSGQTLAKLARCYASKIIESNIEFDLLFGPAYKGIPLAAATAAALAIDHNIDMPYAFNRKEAKQHGEGGSIVGSELTGRILIIDDVITAGTAIREVIQLLKSYKTATVAGVVIGLDRQETGVNGISAIEGLKKDCNVDVHSIVTIEHLMEFLSKDSNDQKLLDKHTILDSLKAYWQKYGSKNES